MSVLRAEVKQRLGDHSIYDGVVENASDFDTEPILQAMHYGSLMICMNLDSVVAGEEPPASDLYVKQEDGTWAIVTSVNQGKDGESAYDVAVDNGYVGTEQEWLASLVGPAGQDGEPGPGAFYATFYKNGNLWECDKTLSEIGAADAAGQMILFKIGEQTGIASKVTEGSGSSSYIYYVAQMVIDDVDNNPPQLYAAYYIELAGVTVSVRSLSGSSGDAEAVHYTADSNRTASEKAQARTNIDGEPKRFVISVTRSGSTISAADKTFAEIIAAFDSGKDCEVHDGDMIARLYTTDNSTEAYFVNIQCAMSSDTGGYNLAYCVDDTDAWSYRELQLTDNYVTVVSASPSISPNSGNVYQCGTLTSLTITNPAVTGGYSVVFTSGSTATTTTIPSTILGLESFAAEANTMYEINVLDNRAVVGKWAVSSS